MTSITTHVLDTATGAPIHGLGVKLESLNAEKGPGLVSQQTTNNDGRALLLKQGELEPGAFQLVFETGEYFEARGTESFYPSVVIVFRLDDPDANYHVPLVLSPFAYSTYRGSV